MKNWIYILLVPLMICLGGCGDKPTPDPAPTPDPNPDPVLPTLHDVTIGVKSDISGVSDVDIAKVFNAARLNVYDKDDVLVNSVVSSNFADVVKSVKLSDGNYTFVLLGNVPDDNITKSEIGKTKLTETNVSLIKRGGSKQFSPIGDVVFAKEQIAVSATSKMVVLKVVRTLPIMQLKVSDNTASINKVGFMIRDVTTTMPLKTGRWGGKGDIFTTFDAKAKSVTSFEGTISCSSSLSAEGGGALAPPTKVSIIAQDASAMVVMNKQFSYLNSNIDDKKSNVFLNFSVETNSSGEVALSGASVVIASEDTSVPPIVVPKEDFKVDESTIKPEEDLSDDDWLPMPTPPITEYPIIPNVDPSDWGEGSDEDIDFGENDKTENVLPGVTPEDWGFNDKEEVIL